MPIPAAPAVRLLLGGCAAAVLLTGCATGPAPTPTSHDVTVAPASPTVTSTATPVPLPEASPLPEGDAFVTSASHGVSFALPSSWTTFDLTTFTQPEVRAALEPLAAQLGVSVDDYIAELSTNNDLIVTGPEDDGFAPSVSVRREAARLSDYVPTPEQAQQELAGVGTVTGVTTILTPLGPGFRVAYTRSDDGAELPCALLGLPSAKGTMFMASVETADATQLDALVTGIVTTLHAA